VQPVLSRVEARRTTFYLIVAALLAILPALSTAEAFGVLVFYPLTSSGQRPYAQRQGAPVPTTQALFAAQTSQPGLPSPPKDVDWTGNGKNPLPFEACFEA